MSKTLQTNAIDWFEIPVRDILRAQSFYEALLGAPMRREKIAGNTLAVFSYAETGVGGCLMAGESAPAPSSDGTLIYLNAGPRLDDTLARVAAAGGRITTPKVELPDGMGCFAHVADTEGNRIGLHALA
ncbi:MAG TPA: VOC family protein [Burkholderiaceae bacterium]|nr:VOC family protein [Burkholderiaceae bacterium]